MPSRRDLLALALAAAAATVVPRRALAAPGSPERGRPGGPRYFVSIFLSGGIDPVYTTDPKIRAEVEPWVDVPYGPEAIVEAGDVRLGPHFAPLAPLAPHLAILNGIALRTANHTTGSEQFLRMKTGTRPAMPSLLQLLGQHRDGQALGCVDWLFGGPQFSRLFDATPAADLQLLARQLRAQARRLLQGSAPAEARVTAGSLEESAELFERVAVLGPPRYQQWTEEPAWAPLAVSLQRTLWMIENDLARGVELDVGGIDQPWDTHTFNADRQASASAKVALIARFLGELSRRTNRRGSLAAQTLVVMGSEIGRFPALNGQHGKDHFPEAPCVLFGAGVNAGGGKGAVYGRTGKKMEAARVALATGRDTAVNGHEVLLDDLGATLLYLGGVSDPSVYGYDGRVLEFLV